MDATTSHIFFLLLTSVVIGAWQSPDDYSERGLQRDIHYHSKRHMLLRDGERKRRITTKKPKEFRKKPSGHLKPIKEDDMEDEEVISVAIGPPVRQKFDKPKSKYYDQNKTNGDKTAVNIIKDVLTQLGTEFLTRQLNEDFIFGQYVGMSIKKLSQNLKIKIKHDILDLIVKYQKLNTGHLKETANNQFSENTVMPMVKDVKYTKNDTDEGWPDFKNLAKIVG